MFKFLILICLIIKTHSWSHSWTWDDYPSPRGPNYSKCGVTKPAWVCDPDGMLTYEQREEIVELVEDFKEKTKRPNSSIPCMREGIRLVVALAENKIGPEDDSSGIMNLCMNDRRWTPNDTTNCDSFVHGIELNRDGFRYCYWARWLMYLQQEAYEQLNNEGHFSIFDNHYDANEDSNIKLLEVQHSLQDTNKTISEAREALDQQNKTLSELQTAIEENKIQLSEMKQFLSHGQKNITTPKEFSPSSHQLSNNL